MERTVSAFEARRSFGRVLDDVGLRGDKVVVERHGEPVAVVVPMALYRELKRQRDAFFDELEAMAARSNLGEEEAMELAREAVEAVRKETR